MIKRQLASLSKTIAKSSSSSSSSSIVHPNIFQNIPKSPPDSILGITSDYNIDTNPKKINLSVGAYRDSNGKPWLLPSIIKAHDNLHESNKEYTGISGSNNYQSLVQNFLFSDIAPSLISNNSISTVQSLSGTGALKLTSEFLNKWLNVKDIYIPNPTWANHLNIFNNSGLQYHYLTYFNKFTNSINHEAYIKDLQNAKTGSAVLLHACCHNPTGLDPTSNQWDEIIETIVKKNLIPVVDLAYQGFESGNLSKDLHVLSKLVSKFENGLIPTLFLCQSFAKNMGLYGERIGSLSILTPNSEAKEVVESQLKKIIRSIYSSPPIHGAKLVEIVLSNPDIFKQWQLDVLEMSNRIKSMRYELFNRLDKSNHDWSHLIKQNGMFCYTGLTEAQVLRLKNEFAIYCTLDGRFSISGITLHNVDYLAQSIDTVLQN